MEHVLMGRIMILNIYCVYGVFAHTRLIKIMVFLDIRLNSVAPYADAKFHRMDFRVASSIGIPIQVSKEFCPFSKWANS